MTDPEAERLRQRGPITLSLALELVLWALLGLTALLVLLGLAALAWLLIAV